MVESCPEGAEEYEGGREVAIASDRPEKGVDGGVGPAASGVRLTTTTSLSSMQETALRSRKLNLYGHTDNLLSWVKRKSIDRKMQLASMIRCPRRNLISNVFDTGFNRYNDLDMD